MQLAVGAAPPQRALDRRAVGVELERELVVRPQPAVGHEPARQLGVGAVGGPARSPAQRLLERRDELSRAERPREHEAQRFARARAHERREQLRRVRGC